MDIEPTALRAAQADRDRITSPFVLIEGRSVIHDSGNTIHEVAESGAGGARIAARIEPIGSLQGAALRRAGRWGAHGVTGDEVACFGAPAVGFAGRDSNPTADGRAEIHAAPRVSLVPWDVAGQQLAIWLSVHAVAMRFLPSPSGLVRAAA